MIRKRTGIGITCKFGGGGSGERDARMVKGSPLARLMLVKYTVPESTEGEPTRKSRDMSLPHLCDPSLGT